MLCWLQARHGDLSFTDSGIKKLMELENDPDVVICYQDEVHFMAESTVPHAWYPKGSHPKVKSYPGHKSVAYSGFVIPETGELFTTKPDWFNYETTIACIREFLASHLAEDGKHLYIVMDNAPLAQKGKAPYQRRRAIC